MARKAALVLLIANVVGAAAYVAAASPSWVIPQEKALGIHSITGEPFVWAVGALPIFAAFTLLNLIWGAAIVVHRQWEIGRLWLLTALIWFVAVWIDFAHH